MAFFGVVLNAVGVLFLTHAVYSAHEHTTAFANTPLPLDITLELLVGVFILSTGIVVSADKFKPIQMTKWASQISMEGRHGEGRYTREGEEILSEGDPYAFLGLDGGIGGKSEGRRGFWDVRGKRAEYDEWVRGKQ